MHLKATSLLLFLFVAPSWQPLCSQPLFKSLSPRETSVHFSNQVVDIPNHNILIYSNYYGGAGVGVGDFNQYGSQAIFFASNLVAYALYLNETDNKSSGTKDAEIV